MGPACRSRAPSMRWHRTWTTRKAIPLSPTSRSNSGVKRSITSPLRAAQAARTREPLIEKAAEFLATHDLNELTLPGLARIAEVSAPTAYAHFPTMVDLLRAL